MPLYYSEHLGFFHLNRWFIEIEWSDQLIKIIVFCCNDARNYYVLKKLDWLCTKNQMTKFCLKFLLKVNPCRSTALQHLTRLSLSSCLHTFSISWLISLQISLPLPTCSRVLSTPHPPFSCLLLSSLSLLYSFCPSRPICYLPAGSVLRCTAVGLVRIQAGWVTHSQSAAPKAPQAPATSKDPSAAHPWARTIDINAHLHSCLHTA